MPARLESIDNGCGAVKLSLPSWHLSNVVAAVDVAPAFAVLWSLWHRREFVCNYCPTADESDEFCRPGVVLSLGDLN